MFIIENPVLNRYRMASVNQENYLIVAAIDFGTTYSGYAFSTRHDFLTNPTNAYVKEWVDPEVQRCITKLRHVFYSLKKRNSAILVLRLKPNTWSLQMTKPLILGTYSEDYNVQVNDIIYILMTYLVASIAL